MSPLFTVAMVMVDSACAAAAPARVAATAAMTARRLVMR